ncbi:SusC/RagA family TonB-linked outer membrane protein [Deminuibacter soli]|uniref:TonB-dependent receptor n=1 Tax=Deminuibacter soli TaxID=2291815 RepID=A0A3E1NHY5_9BACT|nr:TonB-dependent receptor [Deminuibacter soli]RFM27546.1 TonB-dependent receptor [Deminuibacter soli]
MFMRKLMRATYLLLCMLATTQLLIAQSGRISGKINTTETGALAGASIHVKGSPVNTISGEGGVFTITVPAAKTSATLVISAVGYEDQEVPVTLPFQGELQVTMKETTKGLNEVVVVGYGTSRKKDLTGSVSSISVAGQEKTPVIGTAQLLQGQASGVQVMQNQAQPGGTVFSIRIRGTNSINSSSEPLYVIDGYPGGDISAINPNDIESMDVLKDASSTAIYGSRGANGVIMITTKKGRAGSKGVSIDAYTGIQKVGKRYDMMNATQYATFMDSLQAENNRYNNTNLALPYTADQISKMGAGTDWQDAIFRTAPISNISVGFRGGNADTRYYLSLGYFDQQGIVIGSDYKRGTVQFNLDQTVSKKIKVGFTSQSSYGYQNAPTVNTSGGGTTPSVLWDAVRFNPVLPVYDSTGKYTFMNNPGPLASPIGNPVAYANEAQDGVYNFRTLVNTYGEYEIVKGLKLKSSFGVNYRNYGEKTFVPTDLYVSSGLGSASQTSEQHYSWLSETYLTWDKEFNKNNALNVVGGYTFQHWYDKGFTANVNTLSTNANGGDNLSVGTPTSSTSFYNDNVLTSYFTRVNYRLFDRFLFTGTIRADGSSRFGENNKWGYFPSGAFAWRMGEEDFIRHIKAISDMKLRLSYGVTGNQEIGSYNALSHYSTNSYSLGSGPSRVVGISPSNIPNPDLKWESTATYDAGLDLSLWSSRVNISMDYYYKKTSNLLLNLSIPQTSGYTSILKNAGSVSNQGFELGINTRNIVGKTFSWNTSLNFSTNKNKVVDLGSNKQIYAGDVSGSLFPSATFKSGILLVGQPIGSFYGYVFDGIWQSQEQIAKSGTKQAVKPGDPIYRDLNGDSILNGSDRMILGHALPKFTYGITNNFTLGRFNLNIFLQGVYGNKIWNENRYEIENGSPNFNKLAYVGTDSWHGEGTSNTNARISSVLRRSTGVTSDVIESGSYLRVKTVTLSYDLPLPKITNGVFKSATVYVTGQNLITITKYSGYDPEVNSFGISNALSLGTDYNAYPNYRSYLVGVKFGF